MKIYYYILVMDEKSKPIIRTTECEVEENGGICRPINGELPFGRYVIPGKKGRLYIDRFGYEKVYVVTRKPDLDLAKRLILENLDKRIEIHKKRIAVLEEKRKIIESSEETKEW